MLEGRSCKTGLQLVFAFEDNFCMYPAQKVPSSVISDIFAKSFSKVNTFEVSNLNIVTEHSSADWINE